eukprot:m.90207 g.90207  ORF g.90207 m.90207 type:complete len:301 (-) comp11820_c0_seq1:742-1644(-)
MSRGGLFCGLVTLQLALMAAGQVDGDVQVIMQDNRNNVLLCPPGFAITEACVSRVGSACRASPTANTTAHSIYVCTFFSGLLLQPQADNTYQGTIPTSSASLPPITVCPSNFALTGLCTTPGSPQCRGANDNQYYAVAACTQLALPQLAISSWGTNAATGLSSSSGLTAVAGESSIASCGPGYVAVGACSAGANAANCGAHSPLAPNVDSVGAFVHLQGMLRSTLAPPPSSAPTTAAPTAAPYRDPDHCANPERSPYNSVANSTADGSPYCGTHCKSLGSQDTRTDGAAHVPNYCAEHGR